ncbi:MAG TPA: OmpA family protein [Deltaproteobacteria bacterium]|nr:OmpA family protein [Deltaproteobacteria bacterium]HPR54628.1 OmpA family protein [Deltaproteobacteria bacterium]HXK47240.1 OmpA family protein [Deltaproteobacteria bacterium]
MARKKVVYVEPPRNTLVMLYCSLFLILLTFFVVLASMSIVDTKRQRMAIGSILGSFGVLPGGRSPFSSGELRNLLPQSPPVQSGPMSLKDIRDTMNDTGAVSSITVSEGKLGVTITIKSSILFDGVTDGLTGESTRVLSAVARILSRIDNQVIITGHTDSIPVETPPFNSNWGLSAARALAVLSYLEQKKIPGGRLTAYGMGSSRPLTTNATEEGRRLNRRVEITIVGELPGDVDLEQIKQSRVEWRRSIFYKGFNLELEEQ